MKEIQLLLNSYIGKSKHFSWLKRLNRFQIILVFLINIRESNTTSEIEDSSFLKSCESCSRREYRTLYKRGSRGAARAAKSLRWSV